MIEFFLLFFVSFWGGRVDDGAEDVVQWIGLDGAGLDWPGLDLTEMEWNGLD